MIKSKEIKTEATTTETVEIGYDDIIEYLNSKGFATKDKEVVIETPKYGMSEYENDVITITLTRTTVAYVKNK